MVAGVKLALVLRAKGGGNLLIQTCVRLVVVYWVRSAGPQRRRFAAAAQPPRAAACRRPATCLQARRERAGCPGRHQRSGRPHRQVLRGRREGRHRWVRRTAAHGARRLPHRSPALNCLPPLDCPASSLVHPCLPALPQHGRQPARIWRRARGGGARAVRGDVPPRQLCVRHGGGAPRRQRGPLHAAAGRRRQGAGGRGAGRGCHPRQGGSQVYRGARAERARERWECWEPGWQRGVRGSRHWVAADACPRRPTRARAALRNAR